MQTFKKIVGVVLMLLSPAIIFVLISSAVHNINSGGVKDINQPIPWVIIIAVFTPIAAGLLIFGLYALKGEYDDLPARSEEL